MSLIAAIAAVLLVSVVVAALIAIIVWRAVSNAFDWFVYTFGTRDEGRRKTEGV